MCAVSHTARQGLQAQSSPVPPPVPEQKPHAGGGRKGSGLDLPRHPEISTHSQATRQLVTTWLLMAPRDTRKERVRSLPSEPLLHFPTPAARSPSYTSLPLPLPWPGKKRRNPLTWWGRRVWERREGLHCWVSYHPGLGIAERPGAGGRGNGAICPHGAGSTALQVSERG